MSKDFHSEPFDAGTIKKLEIFRGYIREWLSLFLAANKGYSNVSLYDFFAGPGTDINGVKGSPLIIIEELNRYLNDPSNPQAKGVKINLYFNDDEKDKYLELSKLVKAEALRSSIGLEVENKDFGVAFESKFPVISAPHTANLIILDQSGIKHITEDIFKMLIDCRTTDILFFISSAIIKRFAGEDCISKYFPGISKKQIDNLDASLIHRFVCEYYRKLIPVGKNYYLAPFSIKKDVNIYGVIFGTNSLRGLEKFLNVCWKIDPITGESDYPVDGDEFWEGGSIFEELNVPQKKVEFHNNLIAELKKKSLTNKELYKYCLENGFLPKHVNKILTVLQKDGKLIISPKESKGFYIGWDYYSGKKDAIVTFAVKE